jgi:hypothetical protein
VEKHSGLNRLEEAERQEFEPWVLVRAIRVSGLVRIAVPGDTPVKQSLTTKTKVCSKGQSVLPAEVTHGVVDCLPSCFFRDWCRPLPSNRTFQ